jgi:hypothetical protein
MIMQESIVYAREKMIEKDFMKGTRAVIRLNKKENRQMESDLRKGNLKLTGTIFVENSNNSEATAKLERSRI